MSNDPLDAAGVPQPETQPWSQTENRHAIFVELEGSVDTTVRPIRSPVLRQIRPDQPGQPPPEPK